jgi:hypothetical protein
VLEVMKELLKDPEVNKEMPTTSCTIAISVSIVYVSNVSSRSTNCCNRIICRRI